MSRLSTRNSGKPTKLDPVALEGVAGIFRVLAEPGRLALLQKLKNGELTVGELVEETGTGQPSVSKHLKTLADAGLVVRRKEGVKVYYSLNGEMVFDLCRLVCSKLAKDQENRDLIDYSI